MNADFCLAPKQAASAARVGSGIIRVIREIRAIRVQMQLLKVSIFGGSLRGQDVESRSVCTYIEQHCLDLLNIFGKNLATRIGGTYNEQNS